MVLERAEHLAERHLQPAVGLDILEDDHAAVGEHLPELIAAGVDAVAPVDTSAGMSLGALKAEYGDRLAFVGGIDAESVLRNGTPESIRAAVQQALEDAARGGGLILGASSEELFEDFPLENILAMHEAVRSLGRYPIGANFS